MGHTIPPKRNIIYGKLDELMCFAESTREPYRTRFIGLIQSAYKNISTIVYTNLLEDEEAIIYAILYEKSKNLNIEDKEKFLKCISILIR